MEQDKLLALLRVAEKVRNSQARTQWLSLWEELAIYYLPERRGFLGERNDGEDLQQDLWTSTPQLARRGLQTALSTMLRPPGREWFRARARMTELNMVESVRLWLDQATRITYDALYDPRAMAEEKLAEADGDLVTFGTAIVDVGFNKAKRHLTFRTLPLKDNILLCGEQGEVDMKFQFWDAPLREIVAMFGEDKLTEKMRGKYAVEAADLEAKFLICHACIPNADYKLLGLGPNRLPYASVWFAVDEKQVLSTSGYYEFPYVTPRWDTTAGEAYGRSPAMVGLNDARLLNAITRTMIEAAEKAVDPPLTAPADVIKGDVELYAGGVTYFDASGYQYQGDVIRPINLGKNLTGNMEFATAVENRLYAAFYRDILELPNTQDKDLTATEVSARLDQYLRQAAPVFVRIESDYNAKLINRVFSILFREGFFPEPPEELWEQEIAWEYESPVKAAREKAQAVRILEAIGGTMTLLQQSPEIADNVDWDLTYRSYLMGMGVPQALLKPVEAIMQVREQRAKDMEMAKMAELANKAGPAVAQMMQAGAQLGQQGLLQQGGLEATDPSAMIDMADMGDVIQDAEFEDVIQ